MIKHWFRWAILPAVLLAVLLGMSWYGEHHFPAMTARDVQIRAQLSATQSAVNVNQWLPPTAIVIAPTLRSALTVSSPAEKADLIGHLWTNPAAPVGQLTSRRVEIVFPLQKGRATICLGETADSDSIFVTPWADALGVGGSPPIPASAEQYALDRASSRYFRRWLAQRGIS